MRHLLIALLAAVSFTAPAYAACMEKEAAAAEAAIKVHSELMVIALTCKYAPNGGSLIDMYTSFGQRNNSELRRAEANLVSYYRTTGGAGIADLDKLRTRLGNKYSSEASMYDTVEWCKTAAPKMVQAAYWNAQQFQQASAERAKTESSLPICGGVAVQTVSATR